MLNETTINKDCHSNAYSLTSPALHRGSVSATFRVDFEPEYCDDCIGVFPADMDTKTRVLSALGKRCALGIGSDNGGAAVVLCDGVISLSKDKLDWQPGDEVEVNLEFLDADSAQVTFLFKGHIETQEWECAR